MLKKNAKILGAYILGIVVSLFLEVPLSPFFGNNLVLSSVVTTVVTLGLVYTEMWKFGKYDGLRHKNKTLNAIGYMGFYIVISFIVELIVIIFKPSNLSVFEIIHTIWFFPYIGFYTNRTYFIVSLIATLVTIGISVAAYFMGVAGFSLSDKVLTARKKRIDKKAEKHFEEIEKIKEQYRTKKTEEEKQEEAEEIKEENAVE